ncbi:trans-4-hydroxy-L-proline dehydratase activase [Peptostreptococcus sp. D1]|uniref:trans-4-hydroxy-L-proline dehydratase activase n=1 Tax=Peptostreptococcus sp. D1 TaxID=72304 RepID=UPI0008EE7A7E|nr:trans-4-hydroxy-L-proline dehydratase activase [Peptostreptococcus sp. D1]SFE55556.1 pyruvate formate lyase activating enzyme [Peptostreptococcus sp. D1]
MKEPLIINIQKCSIHDGPGIRTTVFFKGCPLECLWCHNPESQSYCMDFMYDREKCSICGMCIEKCKSNAVYFENDSIGRMAEKCELCGECIDWCLNNARELVGKSYTVEELLKEIEKDSMFYDESGGGVTLSGGEVMCQDIDYIEKLIKKCNSKGISVAIDTCGYAPRSSYERIYNKVDLFLYDIKLADDVKHRKFTGKSNEMILDNLKYLSSVGANINIRIPLIEGVNVSENNEEMLKIINILNGIRVKYVNLLPYHDIMMNKYNKLGVEYCGSQFSKPSEQKLEEIKGLFEKASFKIKIGG